jgi:hypothetical protein
VNSFDLAENFRDAAEAQGLSFGSRPDGQSQFFYLDLNSGQMYIKTDPESVMSVVRLAREVGAIDDMSGTHNAILNLVARRNQTADNRVNWQRPYHVGAYNAPDVWISLRDWLIDNGQDPSSIFSERTKELFAKPVVAEAPITEAMPAVEAVEDVAESEDVPQVNERFSILNYPGEIYRLIKNYLKS